MSSNRPTEQILGVQFFNGSARDAVEYICRVGGYTVVPAAPALANIARDGEYRRALVEADLAIADSGFMVLLWQLLRRRKVARISGLRYLQILLGQEALRDRACTFFILPSERSRAKALSYLTAQRFQTTATETYIAPIYGTAVRDEKLVSALNVSQPRHIIIAVGGGTQEKLGRYLRNHLAYRPAIHCIGAALGFLTGDQKPIPMWADRLYLGWFLRLVRDPQRYARRFSRAFALPGMIWRYGEKMPPLRRRNALTEDTEHRT
jgi:exopolysaccharide biosynthesis WecB/TagA/CpsF family protein